MPYVKMVMNRREFMKKMGLVGAGLGAAAVASGGLAKSVDAAESMANSAAFGSSRMKWWPKSSRTLPWRCKRPTGSLDPNSIKKWVRALPIPGAMPKAQNQPSGVDYYEIAMKQIIREIVPGKLTKIWAYGAAGRPLSFSYPAQTIEAKYNKPVRVKWINDLTDAFGRYLPHLLPVDQTIHWADPAGIHHDHDVPQTPYTGPVPMVPHLHGAHVTQESDGYPEAWFLPDAKNIPAGYMTEGPIYAQYKGEAETLYGQEWKKGTSVYQYPNDQRAGALWFHDHALGMTRANVYAGPAGYYLIRGGPDDLASGILPGGAYEIPLVIQDKSFNADGSLFYPDNRAFFEGLRVDQLNIPFTPEMTMTPDPEHPGMMMHSDIAPIWNPEFFGNTIVVNGKTWPYLNVEKRRYRVRLLNASDSRFYILKLSSGQKFWQIGNDGGFLSEPVELPELLLAPAERADVIIDFTDQPVGSNIILENIGPDEPFGGGTPGVDFPVADPATTGQVIQFRVIPRKGQDNSKKLGQFTLPGIDPLGTETFTRPLSLNELMSMSVFIPVDGEGNPILVGPNQDLNEVSGPEGPGVAAFGPQAAQLGTWNPTDGAVPLPWNADITETPPVNQIEVWEIKNFTADAHPIHIHQIQFEVVNREFNGEVFLPEPWETGFKDTAIMYPGDETPENPGITRVRLKFDIPGLFVWHCHILSHEDNEMMRPLQVLP